MPLLPIVIVAGLLIVVQTAAPPTPLESSVYILDLDNNGIPLTSPAEGVRVAQGDGSARLA